MRLTTALALLLLPAAAAEAQTPLSADAFEALVEGRTLHFTLDGLPYGVERYFPGRRTIWRLQDGPCEIGRWYPEGDAICFTYETSPEPSCWRMLRTSQGHAAEAVEGGFTLEVERIDSGSPPCPGPVPVG